MKAPGKDTSFIDAQIDKILSLNSHINHINDEDVRFVLKEKDVLREYKGSTFNIAITKYGVMLHAYGGYTVFVDDRNYHSLCDTLAYFVDEMDDAIANATEEERKDIEADMMAKIHVILAPTWCYGSAEATYNIAASIVHELNAMVEKTGEMLLQE